MSMQAMTRKPATDAAHDAQARLGEAAAAWFNLGIAEHLSAEMQSKVPELMANGMRVEITVGIPDGTVGAFAVDVNGKRVTLFVLTAAASEAAN